MDEVEEGGPIDEPLLVLIVDVGRPLDEDVELWRLRGCCMFDMLPRGR